MNHIDYTGLPAHMREGTRRYIENGVRPGHFPTAVLCNDFMGAWRRADDINSEMMRSWAVFLHSHAPIGCFGCPDKFEEWCEGGGLAGMGAL